MTLKLTEFLAASFMQSLHAVQSESQHDRSSSNTCTEYYEENGKKGKKFEVQTQQTKTLHAISITPCRKVSVN